MKTVLGHTVDTIAQLADKLHSAAKLKKNQMKFCVDATGRGVLGPVEVRGNRDSTAEQREFVRAKKERVGAYMCRRLGLWPLDAEIAIADEHMDREIKKIKGIIGGSSWPYRKSESSWAGGEHSITVTIGEAGCSGGSTKVWSANGKWSGTNSSANLQISARAIQLVPTIVVGGLVTLDAQPTALRGVLEISWAEQSIGFDLKKNTGHLVRGYHSTAKTPQAAWRDFKAAQLRRVTARLADQGHADRIWVTPESGVRGGNCKSGVDNFIKNFLADMRDRGWGEVGAVRGDFLLAYQDDIYTRRAVRAGRAI